jgi:hypothetical protein
VPKIDGSWRYVPARKAVEVTVTQSQAAEPFRVPIEIGITSQPGELPKVARIELTGRTATKIITVDAEPAAVTLDPNSWLLMEGGTVTRRP